MATGDMIIRVSMEDVQKFTQDAGRASGSIEGIEKAGEKASRSLQQRFGAASQSLTKFGKKAMLSITAPILAAGGLAMRNFANFDQAMVESLAIMGDVSSGMRNQMKKVALDTAVNLGMPAEEAARSYFYLASAGMNAEQALAAMPQVAAFARAGAFDMATATDLATDAQTALGLSSKDAQENLKGLTRVTDVFTKANELANTSVEQVAVAMTNKFGASLRVLKKDVEEGTAVLALLADAGIKGERAGTMAATGIEMLARQGQAKKKDFKALGIEILDANGNMRNMADIADDLTAAFGPMSDGQRAAAFQQLGLNRQTAQFVNQLLGSGDKLRGYEHDLRGAEGATRRLMEEMMEGAGAKMDRFKAQIQVLSIRIGEKLAPHLQSAAAWLGRMADRFQNLSPRMQRMIILTALVAAGLGPVALLMGGAIKAVLGLTAAVKGLGLVLTFLSRHPMVLIVTIVAALAYGFYKLYQRSETLQRQFRWLKDTAVGAFEAIKGAAQATWGWITRQWDRLTGALKGPFETAGRIITGIIDGWKTALETIISMLPGVHSDVDVRVATATFAGAPGVNIGGGSSTGGQLGAVGMRAGGGPVNRGGAFFVGERGPELVRLPSGAYVHNNTHTERVVERPARGDTGRPIQIILQAGSRILASTVVDEVLAVEARR